MKKALLLVATLMLGTGLAVAQQSGTSGSSASTAAPSSQTSKTTKSKKSAKKNGSNKANNKKPAASSDSTTPSK